MLLASRTFVFDRFRFKLPTRELLRVADDGAETLIPLGLRTADVLLFFLERSGDLVSKREIMEAVWPDAVVEESNLTVQISAIRRALDGGHGGESCIQNLPRRGYRFTLSVTEDGQGGGVPPDAQHVSPARSASSASPEAVASPPVATSPTNTAGRLVRNWRVHAAAAAVMLLAAAGTMIFDRRETPQPGQPVQPAEPHRASIVALPFSSASGDPKDEESAAALTEDVTVSLAQIPGAYVIARSTAQTMASRKLPLSVLGSELGVRYVLEGNIRRSADGIALNVQLSEAASGANIWARQLKGSAGESIDLRPRVARTLLFPLRAAFMDAEAGRLNQLPIAKLTAADLLFQVRASFNHQPSTPARTAADVARLERALQLDPASPQLMIILARQLVLPIFLFEYEDRDERLARARQLADQARALAAGSEGLLWLQATILRAEGRSGEAVAAYERLLQAHENSAVRTELAYALIDAGRSAEAVSVFQDAIQRDPGEGNRSAMYQGLGAALIHLGRSDEAIESLQAAQQESSGAAPYLNRRLAIAYAYAGKLEDARRELQEFIKQRPWQTLRTLRHNSPPVRIGAKEWNYEIAGLALAGLRDHVPEDADPGLPTDEGLRSGNLFSLTPIGAPGVSVIRTSELKALIDAAKSGPDGPPLLLSANCSRCFDIEIPRAVGVPRTYVRGPLDDQTRRDLKSWLDRQLDGQTSRRLIVFSWNAERWDARNLSLEFAALGYPNVSWYRGGLEAWDVAAYPVVETR